jgi:hypothetical protein
VFSQVFVTAVKKLTQKIDMKNGIIVITKRGSEAFATGLWEDFGNIWRCGLEKSQNVLSRA